MGPAKVIPEKLFFKIGEVCDLVDVQPHVLRYWESEFPMLSPQKNSAGQRVYRRKDVDIALRIRELLYEEGFKIEGAKRKLAEELRGGAAARLKVVTPENQAELSAEARDSAERSADRAPGVRPETRLAIKSIKRELEDLLTLLEADATKSGRR
jgi:DNA-binding transcriptional MerR regulator